MIFKALLVLLVVLAASQVAKMIYLLGYHKTLYNHQPGLCRPLPLMVNGSEDITMTSKGLVFMSTGYPLKPDEIKGRIFSFDFNNPSENAIEVTIEGNFDQDNFHPHGISHWEDPNTGQVLIHIVNHHPKEERIEIFNFIPERHAVRHVKSVTDSTIFSVNDIFAVGPDSFYFTNDFYFSNQLRQVEFQFRLPSGGVGFFDGTMGRFLWSGISLASGINVSPDKRYLYVTSYGEESVIVFAVQEDYSIDKLQVIPVHTGVDNLEVDTDTGDLWLGCHPVQHQLVGYLHNKYPSTPSQVLRIRFKSDDHSHGDYEIQEVFVDDGAIISGSSVAKFYKNKLLIGSVLHTTLYCEIAYEL
ncbi:serum paraoxonase/arylesterase 2-like [Ptychodera flava]|uniref:serum paraoxonase/arylesterase 2-like n=1 Tax=Ptychodera flava TaxID=63121 RepID=UPI00396A6860